MLSAERETIQLLWYKVKVIMVDDGGVMVKIRKNCLRQ